MRTAVAVLQVLLLGCMACALAVAPQQGQPVQPAQPPTLADAEKAYAEVSNSIADLLWFRTDYYYHTGRWDDVIELIYGVIDLDPSFVEAYRSGAFIIWSKKTPQAYKEAVALYDRGIKSNPDGWEIPYDCGAWFYMSHMRLAKKMTEAQAAKEAIPYLRLATQNVDKGAPSQKRAQVWRAFGHTLRRAGQPKAAARAFKRVLEINPADAVALKELQKLEAQPSPGGR
jgi:tetratricopeptide (TPR) repeat protein